MLLSFLLLQLRVVGRCCCIDRLFFALVDEEESRDTAAAVDEAAAEVRVPLVAIRRLVVVVVAFVAPEVDATDGMVVLA